MSTEQQQQTHSMAGLMIVLIVDYSAWVISHDLSTSRNSRASVGWPDQRS